MKRMTNRQRFIAAAIFPMFGGYCTRAEVKEAKKLARGRFWDEKEFQQFCAFSPTGRRQFFEYDSFGVFFIARQAARLWAKGKYKESQELISISN